MNTITEWLQFISVLLVISSIWARAYPQRTQWLFSQLGRYFEQWVSWMGTKQPVRISSYQAAVSPMMVLSWMYRVCIYQMIILMGITAVLGTINVVFNGLAAYRLVIGWTLCGAVVWVLWYVRDSLDPE